MDTRAPLNLPSPFQIPDKFLCPISRQIMLEPVIASDGHTYEKEEIEAWMKRSASPSSPLTRAPLERSFPLKINQYVKSDIAEFVSQNKMKIDDADFYLPTAWKTELIRAVSSRNDAQFEICVKKDARLTQVPIEGNKTLFMLVCERGTPSMIEKTIAALGVDAARKEVLLTDRPLSLNPLYLAWQSNQHGFFSINVIMAQLRLRPTEMGFLWSEPAVKKPNYLNQLFLEICRNGTLEEIDVLLKAGAQVDAVPSDGKTGLFYACEAKSLEKLEGLRQCGAALDARNKQGQTLLHVAAQLAWKEGCLYLMENGLKVDAKDQAGKTAFLAGVGAYRSVFCELLNHLVEKSFIESKVGIRIGATAKKILGALNYPAPSVIHALFFGFKNRNFQTCGSDDAAMSLGQLGHPNKEVIGALQEALKDSLTSIRFSAAEALLLLGEETSESLHVLMAMKPEVHYASEFSKRRQTIRLLTQSEKPSFELISTFIQALEKGTPWQPHEVVEACMTRFQKMSNVRKAFLKAVAKGDQDFLAAVAENIDRLDRDNPQLIEILIKKAMEDKNSWIREEATRALGRVKEKNPEIISALIKGLAETESFVSAAAIEALGHSVPATPEVVSALETVLKNPKNSHAGVLAAKSLLLLGQETEAMKAALLKWVLDSQWNVRQMAVELLSQLKNQTAEVQAALLGRFEDSGNGSEQVRRSAIKALGLHQPISQKTNLALQKCLSDSDEGVCVVAAWALVLAGDRGAEKVQLLMKGLKNQDKEIRRLAALGLGELREQLTVKEIEILLNALGDHEEEVGKAIWQALKKVNEVVQKPACGLTDPSLLKILLKGSQEGINAADQYGNNALLLAIFEQHVDMVAWLLDQGISVTHTNEVGNSALHCAILARHLEISKQIIKHVPLSAIDAKNHVGETPLMLAAKQGDFALMTMLLEAGADDTVVNKQNASLSDLLAKHGHHELIETLYQKIRTIRCDRLAENRTLRIEVDALKQQVSFLQEQLGQVLRHVCGPTGTDPSNAMDTPPSSTAQTAYASSVFTQPERQLADNTRPPASAPTLNNV